MGSTSTTTDRFVMLDVTLAAASLRLHELKDGGIPSEESDTTSAKHVVEDVETVIRPCDNYSTLPAGTVPPKGASDPPPRKSVFFSCLSRYFGMLMALFGALHFSLSALTIKLLEYNPINFAFWRFAIMTAITIPFVAQGIYERKGKILTGVWPFGVGTLYLFLQAFFGVISVVLMFYGLKYLDIGDCVVIHTSAPVFVTLVGCLFLKEPCGLVSVFTACVALVGVGFITRPPVLTGEQGFSEDTLLGVFYSGTSMFLLTFAMVIIRHLRKVHHSLMQFTFSLTGFLLGGILAVSLGVWELPTNSLDMGMIILNAMLAFTGQTCFNLALKYEEAGFVALLRTTEVFFGYIIQVLFLEAHPDFYSFVGAGITLVCVLIATASRIVSGLPDGHRAKVIFRVLLI